MWRMDGRHAKKETGRDQKTFKQVPVHTFTPEVGSLSAPGYHLVLGQRREAH